MSTKQIDVLNKGFVRLDAHCADDLGVVNAARVSLHNHHEEMQEGDDKLIGFLMRNRHGTPFEHNMMRFHVKAPIFVFREWHRHRIGISINEWSARYAELQPDFYIPEIGNVRVQTGKPGAYTYEVSDSEIAEAFIGELETRSNGDFQHYRWALSHGIAKEQARLFLPVNIYSEMYWTCNARSLMAFLSLRNAPQAQWEIRQYAITLETFLHELMPITAKYFVENERKAP